MNADVFGTLAIATAGSCIIACVLQVASTPTRSEEAAGLSLLLCLSVVVVGGLQSHERLGFDCRGGLLAWRQPYQHAGGRQVVPQVWGPPQASSRTEGGGCCGAPPHGWRHCPLQQAALPPSHVHHGSQSPSHALEVSCPLPSVLPLHLSCACTITDVCCDQKLLLVCGDLDLYVETTFSPCVLHVVLITAHRGPGNGV